MRSPRVVIAVALAAALVLHGAGHEPARGISVVGAAGPTGSDASSVADRPTCGDAAERDATVTIGARGEAVGRMAHTEIDGHALVLRTELPRVAVDCPELLGASASCADEDGDGLVDAWELMVLARLGPVVRLDAEEPLLAEPGFAVALVGRVAPAPPRIRVFMALLYTRDYGSCGGITAHHGDAERVVMELAPLPGAGAGDVRVERIYTAAHEDGVNRHNQTFQGDGLAALVLEPDPTIGEPRWIVYASRAKHATYGSQAICERISILPCLHEHCSRAGGVEAGRHDLLLAVANAGEPDHPLLTSLAPCGFPGEESWAERPFCGGLGGSRCASPVRRMLLEWPF